jgi:hypothetical protein
MDVERECRGQSLVSCNVLRRATVFVYAISCKPKLSMEKGKMYKHRNSILSALALPLLALAAGHANAAGGLRYEVTVTNATQAQTFTPLIVTTHRSSIALFELGSPASTELEILAEGGDTGPLAGVLEGAGRVVRDIKTGDGLLGPGASVSFVIRGYPGRDSLSLAAMLIPTNDTFVALDTVRLPYAGSVKYMARAYDAGTEANDQSCGNMPGPRCGGEGYSPVPGPDDEGFVHVSNGFHELGDTDADGFEVLGPATYDWRNPVATVTIRVKRAR